MHMKLNEVIPKAHDLSPVVVLCAHDATPLTLPEKAPPTDPPADNSQLHTVKEKIAPTDSPGLPLCTNQPRCEIKLPICFKDYVNK